MKEREEKSEFAEAQFFAANKVGRGSKKKPQVCKNDLCDLNITPKSGEDGFVAEWYQFVTSSNVFFSSNVFGFD